jgi:chromosome partitioning protein
MRLLVIEDDGNIFRSIELMLKSEGHECDHAELGESGVTMGTDNPYDVIILDLMLPDMEGFEVVRQLRANMVATPILILSGLSELDNKVKGLGVGADDYLTKPFDRDELVARVQALMRRSMGYSTAPEGGAPSGSLLARKGGAAPWSFNMSYTPYGQDADEIAPTDGIETEAPGNAPPRPRRVITFSNLGDIADEPDFEEDEYELEDEETGFETVSASLADVGYATPVSVPEMSAPPEMEAASLAEPQSPQSALPAPPAPPAPVVEQASPPPPDSMMDPVADPAADPAVDPVADPLADPVSTPDDSAAPNARPQGAGRVIVIGNEKGGTGKSTTAMHLVVALLRDGHSVASIDLDTRQGTLTRYLENRRNFAEERGLDLPLPAEHAGELADATPEYLEEILEDWIATHDFVVIDTPGGESMLSNVAHEWADTLIAPINDSLVDLDVLARIEAETLEIKGPSHYADMVAEARKLKADRTGEPIDWIVLRNRLSSLHARNKQNVGDILTRLSEQIGFRQGPGLSERVIYRELFLSGLTLLDLRDRGIDVAFTMSHVAARQELRALMLAVQPAAAAADADADADADVGEPGAADTPIAILAAATLTG